MKFSCATKYAAALLLAFAIGISPAAGQEDHGKQATIKVEVDRVSLYVTVTKPNGQTVTGLSLSEFQAFEFTGKKPRKEDEVEIEKIATAERPASICIVADTSGSIGGKLPALREALSQFMKTANQLDDFCLIDFFDGRAEVVSDFGNANKVIEQLVALRSKGETPLLDGIYIGLSLLRKKELEERDDLKALEKQHASTEEIEKHAKKRVLLILSDGGDNHSRYTEADIKRAIEEADCQIYAIGIFDPVSTRGRTPEELRGPPLLQELTEMKGGRVFAVENPNDLENVAAAVSLELRNQYILFYRPPNDSGKKNWKKVQVKVKPPKGMPPLTAHTKAGYSRPNY